jgi:hypothetical protein
MINVQMYDKFLGFVEEKDLRNLSWLGVWEIGELKQAPVDWFFCHLTAKC